DENVLCSGGSANRTHVKPKGHNIKSATGVNLTTVHHRIFCTLSLTHIIVLTSIPVLCLGICFPQQIRLPVAPSAATHAAAETTAHAAPDATAMHACAEG